MMAAPPSTARIWPVILAASGLRRNAVASATACLSATGSQGMGLDCAQMLPMCSNLRDFAGGRCGDGA